LTISSTEIHRFIIGEFPVLAQILFESTPNDSFSKATNII